MTLLTQDLKDAMRSLHPTTDVPSVLEQRVANLATIADARTAFAPSFRRLLLGLSAGAVVLACVFGFFAVLSSRPALALDLRQIASNLGRANGYHLHLVAYNGGKSMIRYDMYRADGSWRTDIWSDGIRLTQIKANGLFWNYSPDRHTAWYHPDNTSIQNMASVEQFQEGVQRTLAAGKGENLGVEFQDGHRLEKIAIPGLVSAFPLGPLQSGRTVFWIDRTKMLPAITEVQVQRNGSWITLSRAMFFFGLTLGPDTFTVPRTGVRIFDIHRLGAESGKRYAHPLAQKTFPTGRIALRDVQVNQSGDIFVLYMDGSTQDRDLQSSITISDDRDTIYAGTAGAIEPFMYHQEKTSSRGMTIGKEVLQGACVIPVRPLLGTWQPRTILIVIRTYEHIGPKPVTRAARFAIPVSRPVSPLLPTYANDLVDLSLAGGNANQYKLTREQARRVYYENKRDWPGMIAATDRAIVEGVTDVNTYLDRAGALANLHRWAEAHIALAEARKKDAFGFYTREITRRENELPTFR